MAAFANMVERFSVTTIGP